MALTGLEPGPSPARTLFMYGASTLRELNTLLEQGSVDQEDRKAEIRAAWREAARRFYTIQASEDLPELAQTLPLTPAMRAVADGVQETATFKETFANFPVSFEQVGLDYLIATQRGVNLSYAETIRPPERVDEAGLASLCLHPHGSAPPVRAARTAVGYALASDHPGLALLGVLDAPYEERAMARRLVGGQLSRVVMVLFGFPIATMAVIRVGHRLILSNGFHRVYRLRRAGVEFAPALVMHCQFPELELPERLADSDTKFLCTARRPPLVKDFFNPDLVCQFLAPRRTKSIQLTIQAAESEVPDA